MGAAESKGPNTPHHSPSIPPTTVSVEGVFDTGKKKLNPTFGLEDEDDDSDNNNNSGGDEDEPKIRESFSGFGDGAAGELQYAVMADDGDGDAKGEVVYTAVGFGGENAGNEDESVDDDDQRVVYSIVVPEKKVKRTDGEEEVQYTSIGFGDDAEGGGGSSDITSYDVGKRCTIEGLSIPSPPRFMTISEDGCVTYWSNKLKQIEMLKLDELSFKQTRSLRVTDVAYMSNAFKIVIATTNRDIRFYHATTGACTFRVDLPDVVYCVDAWFDPIRPDHSIIAVGDMKGVGIVLKFNEATTRLFNEVPKWQENQCALKNLEVAPENMRGQPTRVQVFQYQLHIEDGEDMMNQSSLKMMYIPELEGFYSCAKTKKKSLVFFTLDTEKDVKDRTRSFDIPKGCNSFDFFYTDTSKDGHHLIITGGNDKIVRFWNPYVPTYPVATLTGHRSTIVCVMANSVNKQVITLAEEEIIKIWDVEARVCLNTLGSMIPHHLVQYSSDTSSKCMWHEQTQTMLITTYTELACIMMSRDNVTAIHSSHDMPVSCTTYIAEFNIVATGCVAGTIICWDLSSGGKIISYDHAHGSAVSTLAVCVGGRRLLSGASNGEIYVWGTLSGMLLQKLVKELPSEVTGIFSTHHRIYSAGWDRKLISFVADNDIDLAKAPSIINQDLKWDPAERHNEDITSMDSCGESLVATGAYDGMIIIWNVKLAKAVNQFDSKSFRVHLHMERFADSDANAPAIAGQKGFLPEVHSNSRPSVDVVVWLGARIKKMAASRMRGENSDDGLNVASLAVACDGGCVNFWNAIKGDLLGGFHAVADKHGPDFVSSMAVNRDNTLLYTGDSIGHLRIYDISTYCVAGRDSKPPRVIEEWRAHMMSISALYYVESAKLLITASLDQSVRVWNGNTGVFIGTFGGSTWSLPIKGRPSIAAVSHVSLSHKAATQFRRTAIAKKKPSDTIEDEDENDGSDGSNGNGSTAVRVSATEAGRAGDRGTSKATLPPVPEVDESEEKKKREKKKRNSSVPQKKGAGGGGGDDGAELEFPALKKAEMQVENLSEAEASHWDNKMRGSHRATAIGAAILGRDFALPRIKKENEDFDVNEYQESKGILGSMASRMVQDDKFKTTAQGRAVGASFQPLDWERECVLGKAFSKRAHKHHNEKQEWRKLTPRPDVRKSEISGQ